MNNTFKDLAIVLTLDFFHLENLTFQKKECIQLTFKQNNLRCNKAMFDEEEKNGCRVINFFEV